MRLQLRGPIAPCELEKKWTLIPGCTDIEVSLFVSCLHRALVLWTFTIFNSFHSGRQATSVIKSPIVWHCAGRHDKPAQLFSPFLIVTLNHSITAPFIHARDGLHSRACMHCWIEVEAWENTAMIRRTVGRNKKNIFRGYGFDFRRAGKRKKQFF
jgi:hypothetical protein